MSRTIDRRDLMRLGTAGLAGTALAGGLPAQVAVAATRPDTTWYPAHPDNYSDAERTRADIKYIVVHTTQGSWSGSFSWFQNRAAKVSAHFVIRSDDGRIAQCVRGSDIAWHAGNWTFNQQSIGIEHEGYIDDPGWYTDEMYRASARLAAFLVNRWDIPINRTHIIGHNEVPGADHRDPGRWWWWSHYMELIRRYADT
jgi:N-acetyl-anhydromuramyl-L-alanine amidase AmpD